MCDAFVGWKFCACRATRTFSFSAVLFGFGGPSDEGSDLKTSVWQGEGPFWAKHHESEESDTDTRSVALRATIKHQQWPRQVLSLTHCVCSREVEVDVRLAVVGGSNLTAPRWGKHD